MGTPETSIKYNTFFVDSVACPCSTYFKFSDKGKRFFLTSCVVNSFIKEQYPNKKFICLENITLCMTCCAWLFNIPPSTVYKYTYVFNFFFYNTYRFGVYYSNSWSSSTFFTAKNNGLLHEGPKQKYSKEKWYHKCHGPKFQQVVEFILENDLEILSAESYPTKTRFFVETRV